ncbi:MAG: hypothetical protein WBD55_04215 [Dehalococcoidia bacterium]
MALLASVIACALPAATSAALPDGRAYEMVSPPDKRGGEVMAYPVRTRAAADGDALAFASLNGFGDTSGTGIAVEYMSRRDAAAGSNGWSTHGLFPKLEPLSVDLAILSADSQYVGDFSSDFTHGLLKTITNLSGDPNLGQVPNLYLRTDLNTPGAGSYVTISECPLCSSPIALPFSGINPQLVGFTDDMGHILFESRYNLVLGATGGLQKLYEWDHGTLRLVGILPVSEGGTVAPRSLAGSGPQGSRFTPRVMSQDGSRIFFTTESGDGPLYMRENAATTELVSASERTDCAGDLTCGGNGTPDPAPDPGGTQPAHYWSANVDGSVVYLSTSEKLTDDDDNGLADLYRYDASLPASDPHNLTRISIDNELASTDGVATVFGVSDDGSYVYFTANGQLVSGGPTVQGVGLYLWHNGTTTYIGDLRGGLDSLVNALGGQAGTQSLGSRTTPDGRHLVFTASKGDGLTGYDHTLDNPECGTLTSDGSCTEIYIYSADTDALACASCNPSGAPATTDASFVLFTGRGAAGPTTHLSHALSDDGARVFFTTAERLVQGDENGKRDVYEYDVASDQAHLISSGKDTGDSFFLDASAEGDDIFFVTRERLSRWDVDNSYDAYDARVGGGLPEPPVLIECTGDACRGPLIDPPSVIAPPSQTFFQGNDNVKSAPKKPAKKCKKGKVRRRVNGKVRCVKKPHHKSKQSRAQRRAK